MNKQIISKEQPEQALFNELSKLIQQSRQQVVIHANSVVNLLFWQVGKRITEHVLQYKRAD